MTDQNPVVPERRGIRSFVVRAGRMTEGQKKAYEAGWPRFGLEPADGMIDPVAVFGRKAPLNLEIGFGMGGSLAEMADAARDQNFIGVEVHRPGVGALLKEMQSRELDNIRLYCCDANEVIDQCLPDGCLDRVLLFFPDPWHKKRHHKRRLVQPGFVQRIRRKLAVGGILHMATDWEDYAEHMLAVMGEAQGYENLADDGGYCPRPDDRPRTKLECRGERLGHGVWDLLFRRTH